MIDLSPFEAAGALLNGMLPADLGTVKVVFAILLKEGIDITADSLFAFAQISLVKALRELTHGNADVTVLTLRRP